jgi:hypothetical protein
MIIVVVENGGLCPEAVAAPTTALVGLVPAVGVLMLTIERRYPTI